MTRIEYKPGEAQNLKPTTVQEFRDILETMYAEDFLGQEPSRLEFLSNWIFDIHTYDGEYDEEFAAKMVEVIEAILQRKTFEYIAQSKEHERWYLLMTHFEFLVDKLSWGTSIRGAWFDYEDFDSKLTVLESGKGVGSWVAIAPVSNNVGKEGEQTPWLCFIQAVIDFSRQPTPVA